MVREYTYKLICLCEEGFLTHEQVFKEMMAYLSEDEVRRFCLEGFAGEIAEEFKDLEDE